MANLPQEIIVNILLRLPVKSLCRFKCVCKCWRSLISDRGFIRLHLNAASSGSYVMCQRLRLGLTSTSLGNVYTLTCGPLRSCLIATPVDYPLKGNCFDEVKFIGSCNGLLCIATEPGTLLLINPATRQYKEVPKLENRRHFSRSSLPCMFGFGHVASTNDYKLVKIACKSFVYLYSAKANNWRWVGTFPYYITAFDPGTHLNGVIHWVVSRYIESQMTQTIGAFDLTDENFREVSPPAEEKNFYAIGVFGRCLCILPGNDLTARNEFWVMKEYGANESWTRIVISTTYLRMKPLGLFENDEALVEIDGQLIVYNLREGRWRELVIHGIPPKIEFEVEPYVESLVSPNIWN